MDESELQRALGSAGRLAVENEALRAEALSQLRELRSSRMRIVEAGDAARRRLERNLHDGAQQRLLALSFDLRLARVDAAADGDEPLTAVLDAAARRPRPRSRSCATSPTASTPRFSPRRGSRPRWQRSSTRRRYRSSWTTCPRRACRRRSRARPM